MELIHQSGLYQVLNASSGERAELVRAGFKARKHSDGSVRYVTSSIKVAAPYHALATSENLRSRLVENHKKRVEGIRPSFAVDSRIVIPTPPGRTPRPYQRAGVAYAVVRERTLIADSMRLGKTIQAICASNWWDCKRVLIVCPATAKVNWQREWTGWSTSGKRAEIVHKKSQGGEQCILGLDADVCIINYDILRNHHVKLSKLPWDLVIYDESHYLKNEDANRTKCCFGSPNDSVEPLPAKRYIALDGTPVYSRIWDLWPICRFMDPTGLGASRRNFQIRYCDGKMVDGVWDYSGASNLEELQERMRATFMIRREKNDVVAEIPPNRQTHVIPAGAEFLRLINSERNAFGAANLNVLQHMYEAVSRGYDVSVWMNQISRLDMVDRSEVGGENLTEENEGLSSARKKLALSKVQHTVDYVRELLQTRDKVVIMAHHREVVEAYHEAFADLNAVKLYGGMTPTKRQEAIDNFREDPACRVFVGNIISAGQAISLAKSDDIVFAELSWVPAEMDQAEERIWDPLKLTPCNIHRVVVEDSLDEAMAFVLDKRQKDITKALKIRALLDSVGASP
jgi:SWI/SNF-related matrix-associated actin-dependent regulator of chromatin subfamily A-like protein 1